MTNASAVPSTPRTTSATVEPRSGVWPGVVAIPIGNVTRPASVTLIHDVWTAASEP